MKVRLHWEALADMDEMAAYFAEQGSRSTERFLQDIEAKILGLGSMAEAFPFLQGYEQLGIRRRIHGKYRILYRIAADGDVVVLRVLHTARDLLTAFLETSEP